MNLLKLGYAIDTHQYISMFIAVYLLFDFDSDFCHQPMTIHDISGSLYLRLRIKLSA